MEIAKHESKNWNREEKGKEMLSQIDVLESIDYKLDLESLQSLPLSLSLESNLI